MSQSPQTGQVYFKIAFANAVDLRWHRSQSPQTGQVYFKLIKDTGTFRGEVSQSPQTGQVYFNKSGCQNNWT